MHAEHSSRLKEMTDQELVSYWMIVVRSYARQGWFVASHVAKTTGPKWETVINVFCNKSYYMNGIAFLWQAADLLNHVNDYCVANRIFCSRISKHQTCNGRTDHNSPYYFSLEKLDHFVDARREQRVLRHILLFWLDISIIFIVCFHFLSICKYCV